MGDRGLTLDELRRDGKAGRRVRRTFARAGMVAGRFFVAVGISAALCYLALAPGARHLSTTTDIVGYPIVADYAFNRYFDCS